MPLLKGGLHIHTSLSDGTHTPEEIIEIYRDLGFHFIAITDHDFLVKPDYMDRIPQENSDILIFKGIELTVFAQGYMHVNKIIGDTEELYCFNHPAECDMPPEQVIKVLEEISQTTPIHCVEITSKGFYTTEFDIPEIPYPKIATDDSHTEFGCGRAWIEVDCELEKDAIIRAIKAGKAKNRFR